jgi:hypothetical protein
MKKEVKEFTINRSRWHTGEGTKGWKSALFVPETKRMCCLGFYGKCLGRTQKDMSKKLWLQDTTTYEYSVGVLDYDTQTDLANVNDDEDMTLPQKEKEIKAIFAKKGIKVKFVGKLMP